MKASMTPCSSSETTSLSSALRCVDCGKCSALCPMAEMYADFDKAMSPRGLVRQVLAHRGTVQANTPQQSFPALAGCVQCRSCSQTCPEEVDPAGLIACLRQRLATAPTCCPGCGAERPPARARTWLQTSTRRTPGDDDAYLDLCPSCRRQAYIRNNR